jgi:hypothetical protein
MKQVQFSLNNAVSGEVQYVPCKKKKLMFNVACTEHESSIFPGKLGYWMFLEALYCQ